jgi:hypothetical protein
MGNGLSHTYPQSLCGQAAPDRKLNLWETFHRGAGETLFVLLWCVTAFLAESSMWTLRLVALQPRLPMRTMSQMSTFTPVPQTASSNTLLSPQIDGKLEILLTPSYPFTFGQTGNWKRHSSHWRQHLLHQSQNVSSKLNNLNLLHNPRRPTYWLGLLGY